MAQCSQEECNLLVFEAVYENSIYKLQSAIDRYNLNQILKSLSTCNQNGESPMVVAIKGRNVFIIDKLVKLFLECVVKEKCRPMRCSSRCVVEKLMQKIPILEWMDFFLNDLCDQERLKNIAQIEYPTFSNQLDHIIALELVGAVVLSNEKMIETGLGCWKKAMTIRYLPDSNGEPLYPKVLVTQDQSAASNVVFGSAVEVNSMEELDLLLQRPERQNNPFFLRIQGLLVLRRIALQANAGPYWVYLKSLFVLASDIMSENITYAVNTHLLIMEQLIGRCGTTNPHQLSTKTSQVFIETLFSFGSRIHFEPHNPADETEEQVKREILVPEKLIHITKFINTVVKFFPKPEMIADFENMSEQSILRTAYSSYVAFGEIIFSLMLMMETTTQQMTNQEEEELEKNFSYYIQNLFPERTTTPLHMAALLHHGCYFDNHPGITVEILCETVKRMLKLGADPNALNESGETPLHIELWDAELPDFMPRPIIQALVNAGGHLDMADDYGETVISLLKQCVRDYNEEGKFVDPYFESLIKTVFPLSSYAARVIWRNGIRYDRLPLKLQKLVSRQSADDFDDDV